MLYRNMYWLLYILDTFRHGTFSSTYIHWFIAMKLVKSLKVKYEKFYLDPDKLLTS